MTGSQVTIRLESNGQIYHPGDTLAGEFRIEAAESLPIKAIEVSVLWYTEGKGDEDLAVHYFQRLSRDDDLAFDPTRPVRFHTVLPNSPLSYNGAIVKIRWCVRVRVFPVRGKEIVAEKPFQLGTVPPPKVQVVSG